MNKEDSTALFVLIVAMLVALLAGAMWGWGALWFWVAMGVFALAGILMDL